MIDTLAFFEELKQTLEPSAAKKIVELMARMYKELSNMVTKEEFNELRSVVAELVEVQKKTELRVKELAEAQKKTEQRVDNLSKNLEELAEAQKKTEQKLNELAEAQKKTEQRVDNLSKNLEELAEAQKKTEQKLNELAEAQKKTEQKLNELAEAQKKTEQKLNELAEAQKETEKEIRALTRGLKETRQMVGNLSDTVGYTLEDRAIKNLPEILEKEYGIKIKEGLLRKYVKYNGKSDELNIYGVGLKEGKEVYIVGEAKSRLSKRHVDRLLKMVSRLEKHGVIGKEKFLVLVTYTAIPEAEEYAKSRGIEIIWSYRI